MIPDGVPDKVRSALLDPSIMVPPLLWLASPQSDGITGQRLIAILWQAHLDGRNAAKAAIDQQGW